MNFLSSLIYIPILKKSNQLAIYIGFCLIIPAITHAQLDSISKKTKTRIDKVSHLPEKQISKLTKHYNWLANKIQKQNNRIFSQMQKKENRLIKQLQTKDSLAAKKMIADNQKKYSLLQKQLSQPYNPTVSSVMHQYQPALDSISTAAKFLEQQKTKITNSTSLVPQVNSTDITKIQALNSSLSILKTRLNQTETIKNFADSRKEILQSYFAKYKMDNMLIPYKKNLYYYKEQANVYKEMINEPSHLKTKLLTVAKQQPAFKTYMQKYSMIGLLYPTKDSNDIEAKKQVIGGLQTRSNVQQLLKKQMNCMGTIAMNNPQQFIQQQMQSAQSKMNELKDKANNLSIGNSSDIPNFTPNSQKTKSFLKRIEYGCNLQTQRPNYLLPVTSDLAFTVGYKLNDHTSTGIGISYKLGLGNGLNKINLTNQGIGLRYYFDLKMKGSIWLSTGYEKNYSTELSKQIIQTNANPHINKWGKGWQESLLIGLSKKYKIGKKENKIQILWDFISYRQIPRAQPIVFRLGYKL